MPAPQNANGPESAADAGGSLGRLQRDFAAHIRDPARHPAPAGIEDRRMAIYRRLFFNNIRSLLEKNFPVLRSLYDDAAWARLMREFYAEHRARTPLFPEIATEFLRYLQDHRGIRDGDPPFLLELAHYEWVELALTLDEREPEDAAADPQGDLLQGRPVLSPLTWAVSYRYPVHRICREFQPRDPLEPATHLLVWRDREYRVRFMLLNEVSRLLLEQLREPLDRCGRELLEDVAAAIGHADPGTVVRSGARVLAELRERGVLLGTRPG